jgi:hypothetical protein
MTDAPHYTDTDVDCSCNPLRLTVEADGSISRVAGGPLEEPIDTGPTARPAEPLDVDRLARAIEIEDDRLPFLDAGIDSTATPRAVAEQIANRYARLRDKEASDV